MSAFVIGDTHWGARDLESTNSILGRQLSTVDNTCQVNNFYTYAYLREDRTPYYIGKGRHNRAWSCHARCAVQRPKDPANIIILKKNMSEKEALNHERYLIAILGRQDIGTGILLNKTNGGEGKVCFSPDVIEKIRQARLRQGNPWPVGSKHKQITREHYRRVRKKYDYCFWGPNGEKIEGLSISEFCFQHPELERSNLLAVARGDRNHCGGWKVTRTPVTPVSIT